MSAKFPRGGGGGGAGPFLARSLAIIVCEQPKMTVFQGSTFSTIVDIYSLIFRPL